MVVRLARTRRVSIIASVSITTVIISTIIATVEASRNLAGTVVLMKSSVASTARVVMSLAIFLG